MISCEESGSFPQFQEFEGFKGPYQNQEDDFHPEKQENEPESEVISCNNSSTTPITNTNTNRRGSKGEMKLNSFSKLVSSFSNVFSKRAETTTVTTTTTGSSDTLKREKKKLESEKNEQDWRMAHFIAELQSEGRSDEEIQLHLFHLRDVAQFTRPRSNSMGSIGEWFRSMHQAFKDEFVIRRERQSVTIHVSTMNPFSATDSSNYIHDLDLGLGLGFGLTYEDLVALESVPRGVKSIDKLPVVAYTGQDLPSDQTSCAICMADFETEEELKWLQCSHYFHKECIDKWLSVGTTCPVCKGEVHTDQDP